jgi:hypothetical protein
LICSTTAARILPNQTYIKITLPGRYVSFFPLSTRLPCSSSPMLSLSKKGNNRLAQPIKQPCPKFHLDKDARASPIHLASFSAQRATYS